MIWKKYEDQTRDEVLQNRFTAYLTSAVSRRRAEYIDKLIQLQNQLNFNSANNRCWKSKHMTTPRFLWFFKLVEKRLILGKSSK